MVGEPGRSHAPALGAAAAVVLTIAAVLAYLTVVPADWQDAWYNAFAPLAALVLLIGILVKRPPAAFPIALLALGLGLSGAGDIAWTLMEMAGEEPFPSIADAFYLLGYLAIAAAIWLLFGRDRRSDVPAVIDALILTTTAALLFWVFFIEAIVEEGGMDPVATSIAIAYPAIDVLFIGLLARIQLGRADRTPGFLLVTGFCVAFLASDVVYSFQALEGTYDGGLVDAGWLLGYGLLAAAGLHPSTGRVARRATSRDAFSGRRLLLLAAASVIAPAMAVVQEARSGHVDVLVMAGGSAVLFLLVILRLARVLDDLRGTLVQRDELEVQLKRAALHDPLTDLANRTLLAQRLDEALVGGRGDLAMVLLDLDDFKTVNDSLGHQAGDEALRHVADRIRAHVRGADLAARIGGDEFAVLVADCADVATVTGLAERLGAAIERPMTVGDRVVTIRASVGVALAAGAQMDPHVLMRNADVAMYLAKSHGKGRVEVFQPIMHAEVLRRLQLRTDLEQAIARGEFVVHYQPILGIDDGRVRGVETLVRWVHPDRGVLQPAEFIGLAESTGLIRPIGRWVLHTATRQARAWQRTGGLNRALSLYINISPVQFTHPSLVDDVRSALQASGMAPDTLTLELTESSLLDGDEAAATMRSLKDLGVRLAIDDFGTGYSALSYLSRFPIDSIKIDRSFVAALSGTGGEAALAAAIVKLGQSLDVETVAEGIEDLDQLRRLREIGCSLGQGFLFSPPVAAEEVAALIGPDPGPGKVRHRLAVVDPGADALAG